MNKLWIQQTSKGFCVRLGETAWWTVSSFVESVDMYNAIEKFVNAMSEIKKDLK